MTLTAVCVRPARWDDRAAILQLIAAMGGHEDVAAGDDPLRIFGAVLADSNARALVADREGAVVGYAELQARPSTLHDCREGWLAALAIAPEERRSGVGGLLAAAVEREAALLGCAAIVVESSSWRFDAHAFYRAHGFTELSTAARFRRELPSEPQRDTTLEQRFLTSAARAASAVQAAIAGLAGFEPIGIGADGAPTEAADAAAERAAVRELAALGFPIVSEESGLIGDGPVDPSEPWISLDPLDGSRNFVNGYPSYAVAMGLVRDGRAIAGFVADLSAGRRWWAAQGQGAFLDGRPIRVRPGRLAGSASPDGTALAPLPDLDRVRICGSSASELCHVADGSLAAFVSTGRPVIHVHDLAGPLAIIREAGGVVLDRTLNVPHLVPDPHVTFELAAAADGELARRLVSRD